jgi:preprotein translocase subunit SecY
MKAIETIKTSGRLRILRQRILITVLFVFIYRIGSFIVLPGVDPNQLGLWTNRLQMES